MFGFGFGMPQPGRNSSGGFGMPQARLAGKYAEPGARAEFAKAQMDEDRRKAESTPAAKKPAPAAKKPAPKKKKV